MKINFNNFTDQSLRQKIQEIFEIALSETIKQSNVSVNITIVGRNKIKQLNSEFRNVDKVTDVLSFPLLEKYEFNDILNTDEVVDLGDIVICKSRAIEQAKEYKHSLQREICFLALHGFLHVLGYDHIQKQDELIMFPLQDKILNKAHMER